MCSGVSARTKLEVSTTGRFLDGTGLGINGRGRGIGVSEKDGCFHGGLSPLSRG